MRRFAAETTLPQARELFLVHADETRLQYELLTSRLQSLGGTKSESASPLAYAFDRLPRPAHPEEERTTLDLILAFAMENAEVAMYEALRITAGMAGDTMTASIVERIQMQEQQAAENIWKLIAVAAARRKGSAIYLNEACSAAKGFLAHQPALSHDDTEKSSQHLIIAYATAAAEMAIYEAMQTATNAAGDRATLKRLQQLQLKASEDHRLAWEKLPEAARSSSRVLLSMV
jgi:ferritin-like metal-binding protein YciE